MRRIRKYKKIFTQGWVLLKYIYFKIYCFFSKKVKIEYKNCWLISEHGDDARDNGYFFYKYVRENHLDIDIRYVITKDSPDFDKINNLGKYIIYGSKDHYLAFINSKLLISTHVSGCSPNVGLFFRLQRYGLLKLNGKNIWLQHGVIGNYLSYANPKDTNLSLLITSTKKEQKYLIEKNGFDKSIVKCTGLARFDNLKKIKSNNILFMPTHRIYMHNISDRKFLDSDYYKYINGLINNERLIKILEKNDLKLILYVHSEFQKYSHLFNTCSQRIVIAQTNEYEAQDLLINSCLLITDYSSVSFDYAYMEKPLIYYQFDYDNFFKYHYSEGYFSYKKDGFGPVVNKENDVIKYIELNIKNNFEIDSWTRKKIVSFFNVRDKNNCKRIYDEIIKINKDV